MATYAGWRFPALRGLRRLPTLDGDTRHALPVLDGPAEDIRFHFVETAHDASGPRAEIAPDKRTALLEAMLDLNISIPLSSFGKVDDRYVRLGVLAADARMEDIAQDVAALSDDAI